MGFLPSANSLLQVMNGTLTFSGGQVVAVPTLPNDGTALPLYFAPITVTSMVFKVVSNFTAPFPSRS